MNQNKHNKNNIRMDETTVLTGTYDHHKGEEKIYSVGCVVHVHRHTPVGPCL